MHDCAISAWGAKGWYDTSRPVTAIRGMAELGQSTDPSASNYHPGGLPLVPGRIETVDAGDPLAGAQGANVGKIKIWAWKGSTAINNVDTEFAGVGWVLAESWEPYQRPSFVSPPFAGYVSGHSTFSRAAAEVLTAFTGDAYFPGGMGTFLAPANEFLVFEDGPSVDVELQWATYRDASDECSLSRIYGGIHPYFDDVPGRLMGIDIGLDAFDRAAAFFGGWPPTSVARTQVWTLALRTSTTTGSSPSQTSSCSWVNLDVRPGARRTSTATAASPCKTCWEDSCPPLASRVPDLS